ncbi:hypothetical protein [Bradyrhizobium sp. DASA03120]|uniref:hypothetical protein n=1 Tax=Bradyrhizobium sp. SMVTL-02 TaxID=3395917 RepID=UPI003F71CD50
MAMAATPDGRIEDGAVFEAKFMLPWNFFRRSRGLQHNSGWPSSRSAVLSIITGGGKWVDMTISAALSHLD